MSSWYEKSREWSVVCGAGLLVASLALAAQPIVAAVKPGTETSEAHVTSAGAERGEADRVGFARRVAAERAIQRVFWSHRLWPSSNPGPRPRFEDEVAEDVVRRRVEDTLRMSHVLESRWNRRITAADLQAEIDRMVKDSRQPVLLRELFAALGDDPGLVAECLVRPLLADRWIHSLHAHDPRLQAGVRSRALAALDSRGTDATLEASGGVVSTTLWVRDSDASARGTDAVHGDMEVDLADDPDAMQGAAPGGSERRDAREGALVVRLEPEAWERRLATLEAAFKDGRTSSGHGGVRRLPVGVLSRLVEDEDAFVAVEVLDQDEGIVRTRTVVWPKRPFEEWWRDERTRVTDRLDIAEESYALPAVELGPAPCTDDTWLPTRPRFVPDPRTGHTAVWTGSEMIVWGGWNGFDLDSGGRYSPAMDTWTTTGTMGAPSPRWVHSAVWTGSRMIVWGGAKHIGGEAPLGTGASYDPVSDTWTPTTTGPGVPSPRESHAAVWSGTEMIVWGGLGSTLENTGSRYDPSTDQWSPMGTGSGVPTPRASTTAIWTGTRMIVWGGWVSPGAPTNTGSRYDPATDTWTPTATTVGSPSARMEHTAVWTGDRMIVWGGEGSTIAYLQSGGSYDPITNTWTPTSTGTDVPSARRDHEAVWTGSRMIIWGGIESESYSFTGGRYDPVSDSWQPMELGTDPGSRQSATAVWTGTEMILWGGFSGSGYVDSGGRYDPVADHWTVMGPLNRAPSARAYAQAVWTGSELFVWGGYNGTYQPSGGRYMPATDSWTLVPRQVGSPLGCVEHTLIWTGSRIVIWGGQNGSLRNTGSLYDPVTSAWTTMTLANAPSSRMGQVSAWTGQRVLVWGGRDSSFSPLGTGGLYHPVNNSWSVTSTSGAPSARRNHAGSWSGTELLIWGGFDGSSPVATGGRYDPLSNAWAPLAVGGPSARYNHRAVWAGAEMIVWGGQSPAAAYLGDGARYRPATDSWAAVSSSGAPSPRALHTAVWTGDEMIVWGGYDGTYLGSGGCYDPTHDSWRATNGDATAPVPRGSHAAAWTQDVMVVWGGLHPQYLSTGARYCALAPCVGPAGTPALTVAGHPVSMLSWSSLVGATSYDVVGGSLQALASSHGDFTAATGACVADDTTATTALEGSMPAPGHGAWFLVRAVGCAAGTYDEGGAGQTGSRDAEIAASAATCP